MTQLRCDLGNYSTVMSAQGLSNSCCGMLFNSRGFKDAAAVKGDDLEASLVAASQGGKIPIVCDTSPCLSQIKGSLSDSRLKCAPCSPSLNCYVKLASCTL